MSKHQKEIKAQEWLKSLSKEPNMKEISDFCLDDIDLKTICISLIDKDQKHIYENTENKNELSVLNLKESFDEYYDFPQWFYVFVPKYPLTAQLLYARKSQDYLLIEELMEQEQYVQKLVDNGIFDSEVNFELALKVLEGKLDAFLGAIQDQVESTRDMRILDCSNNKFNYFQLGSFAEARNNFLKKEKEELVEFSSKYIDTLKAIDSKEEKLDTEEFFYNYMPPTLKMEGTFFLKDEVVEYKFNKQLFKVLNERIKHNALVEEDLKKEKVKKAGAMSFNILKLGTAIAFDVFAGFPILTALKTGVDIMDTTKDSVELSKDTLDVFFHDQNVLRDLFNEYQDSGKDTFKEYLIEQFRFMLYNGLEKYKLKFHIQEETFNYLYQQFMKEYVFKLIGEVDDFVKDQAENTQDADSFWIAYLLEGLKKDELCVTGESEAWNI